MPEIVQFNVTNANATYYADGSLVLNFYYPKSPQKKETRLGPHPEFGAETLEKLIITGCAQIATLDNPISPPNAGSLPITSDGMIICNRRDDGAKVHALYHSPYSGFAQSMDELYSQEGMMQLATRESAEELVLITKERNPHLIVTPTSKQYTLLSAKRLGLDHLPLREVAEEFIPGKDKLNVFYEGGEKIFSLDTHFTMLWDIDASTIAMQIRRLDIHSEEIIPIDAEGMFNPDGSYKVHFNRESFIINPRDIRRGNFADFANSLDTLDYAYPLKNPKVFQSYLDQQRGRIVYTPNNSPLAYKGPGNVAVTRPYLFAPQDTLRACLDGLEVPGYYRRKLHLEQEICKTFAQSPLRAAGRVDESCIIPPQFRA